MSLVEFLVWMTSGGSIIAVSWLCERWAWFQAQAKEKKQMIIYGSSAALSIAAYCINTYLPAATLQKIEPFFIILATTFVSIFLGQVFHKSSKVEAQG